MLVLLTLASTPAAMAQDGRAVDLSPYINGIVMDLCPSFANQIINQPALAPMLRNRPVQVSTVCACTESMFRADRRLQREFVRDYPTLSRRLKTDNLRAYLAMRVMQSAMACLANEFSEVLAVNDPAR